MATEPGGLRVPEVLRADSAPLAGELCLTKEHPDDVSLRLNACVRVFASHDSLYGRTGRIAVTPLKQPSIIDEEDVSPDSMIENGAKLLDYWRVLFPASGDPSRVVAVEPKKCGLFDPLEKQGQHVRAIAVNDLYVSVTAESFRCLLKELCSQLYGIDVVETSKTREDGIALVGASFNESAYADRSGAVPNGRVLLGLCR